MLEKEYTLIFMSLIATLSLGTYFSDIEHSWFVDFFLVSVLLLNTFFCRIKLCLIEILGFIYFFLSVPCKTLISKWPRAYGLFAAADIYFKVITPRQWHTLPVGWVLVRDSKILGIWTKLKEIHLLTIRTIYTLILSSFCNMRSNISVCKSFKNEVVNTKGYF